MGSRCCHSEKNKCKTWKIQTSRIVTILYIIIIIIILKYKQCFIVLSGSHLSVAPLTTPSISMYMVTSVPHCTNSDNMMQWQTVECTATSLKLYHKQCCQLLFILLKWGHWYQFNLFTLEWNENHCTCYSKVKCSLSMRLNNSQTDAN